MDRKTILAIVICFGILMGWQKFYLEPRLPKNAAPINSSNEAVNGAETAPLPIATVPPVLQNQIAFQSESAQTETGKFEVGNGNAVFTSWQLNHYTGIDLNSVTHSDSQVSFALDLPDYAYLADVRGNLRNEGGKTIWSYEDTKIKLTRETSIDVSSLWVNGKVQAEFKAQKPAYAFLSVSSSSFEKDPEAQDRQLIYFERDSIGRVKIGDKLELKEIAGPVRWVGANSRYFLFALLPQGELSPKALIQPVASYSGRASLVYPVTEKSITLAFRTYFGPKELTVLRQVDPTLDHTVDFGWFTVIAYPLLRTMNWLYSVFHNYGIAIILLTLFVKILTYPLTYKSMKSMREMAKIQPQIQRLKDKYKDDKEALNREMLTLMKTHGYNPAAGCFPIVVQMPVFLALYRVLYSSIELYQAPFAFWIHDLSLKDPYYVTPVLLSGIMFLQQKLTPSTATDPAQARMLQMMPLMFGVFMISLPSGLTLYMLVNTIASVFQQMVLNKKLGPLPNAVPKPAH